MARKTKKKQQPEQMTISEFKIWIKGIEAFQGDVWVPNKEQWELIKATIDLIDEFTTESSSFAPTTNSNHSHHHLNTNPRSPSAGSSVLDSALVSPPNRNIISPPIIDSHNVTGGIPKSGPTAATGLADTVVVSGDAGMKDATNLI